MTLSWLPLDDQLYEAAWEGDEQACRALLDQGANPLAQNLDMPPAWSLELSMRQASTALRAASLRGRLGCVELLAPLGEPDDGFPSALALACAGGHADCAALLGRQDLASLSAWSAPYRPPPVLLAAWFGHEATLRALLEMGAPAEMPPGAPVTPEFQPPLVLAAWRGHAECVDTLLQFGADPDARGHFAKRAIDAATIQSEAPCVELLLPVSDLLAGDDQGRTPLQVAIAQSSQAVVEAIIQRLPTDPALVDLARQIVQRRELQGAAPRRWAIDFLRGRLDCLDQARELDACAAPAPARAAPRI